VEEDFTGCRCLLELGEDNGMNNITIAKETIKITKEMKYDLDGITIQLPKYDYSEVIVYSPEDGEELLKDYKDDNKNESTGTMCKIVINTKDSFQAAKEYENPFVMNFANAHNPGGGFLLGSTAQEEALCRCSTLYQSLISEEAARMYKYNNTHLSKVESDYMLLSKVCVFRNEKCELVSEPFMASVITVPAPNRIGAAMFASNAEVADTMLRRIRIMLQIAYTRGYRNLILGAWGCGAFYNNPKSVASYFKQVLLEEGYGQYFDEVCFAIYGPENGKNVSSFQNCFGE